jgi:hypothetical protein
MAFTRREFFGVAGVSLASALAAGAERSPEAATEKGKANEDAKQFPPLIGYGLVNYWFAVDAAGFAKLLASNRCTLTELEYVPWFDENGPAGKSIKTDVDAAAKFVAAMRPHGISTLVSVINWNGEAQRAQPDAWFRRLISEIIDKVKPEDVLLLPVSEPDSKGKSVEWQRYAKEHWPGKLVLNGPGGRGEPTVGGGEYIDWHWCEDFDATDCKPRPYLNNTDCGPVLNPGPKRAVQMARAALASGSHFHVYDHGGKSPDKATIEALGRAIKERPREKR